MNIERITFPEPSLCRVEVREDAAAYEAAVHELYERRRRFYPVAGWPEGGAPLEAIEAQYGADTFRAAAIDHLLLHEFPALRAEVCFKEDLFPLTDTEPELLNLDGGGFAAACTFAVAPRVQLGPYTGQTMAGESPAAALNALVDRLAREAGATPPEYAIQAGYEQRLEELRQRLAQQNLPLERFLQQTQQTQAGLEASLREGAAQALAQKIVLVQIARSEGLFPSEAELDAEISRMVALSAQNAYARSNPAARQSISNRMALNRAVDFLMKNNALQTP